ncbi:GNAT family N-acetyltransferase [Chryseobacterium sp. ISL-6]|uniref:GNAT family N-acetyltransferase n=1 Tax=Chryseobacterium sp. ISL-6 TaxID=2819143 RepID=UPI001BE873F3|nr:GNAT family N-acetyltransferase [Chryseobacterium sp. ISL-6]MBT2620780.1 GNAT family N-acetyltransferase [Chryseobacterium sp. ISL-6]
MEFRNLVSLNITDLLSVFNLSFSDYLVPFHLTLEQLTSKINAEKIDMNFSVGAFQDDQIVGFILHAEKVEDRKRIVYNAGTGVTPEYRGQGLVRKMYDYIIPILQDRNTDVLTLEVIEGNEPAIRAYTNLGFKISRKLLCFKGNIETKETSSEINVQQLDHFQWKTFKSFWDIEPSWQSSVIVLDQMRNDLVILGAYEMTELVGYAIFNPAIGKVYQVAVNKENRRMGIGAKLFKVIREMSAGSVTVVNNVDDSSENTSHFLSGMGLENWVSQFEMANNINIES